MAEESRQGQPPVPPDGGGGETEPPASERSPIRRRDFLVGAGAGVAAAGVVGAGILATRGGTAPPAAVPVQATAAPVAAAQPTAQAQPAAVAQPTTAPQPTPRPQATAQAQTGGVAVTLKVNGVPQSLTVQPNWTLLYVLREQLDLTGTKYGCDRGMCGMCTVVADGRAIYSCMNLAVQHDGADIMTVEGLARGDQLHPLQQAFLANNAFQCAWCTPGFLMSAQALLQAKPSPTMDEIKAGVAGNACRCGTYPKVFQAINEAAGVLRNPPAVPARPLTPGAPVAG